MGTETEKLKLKIDELRMRRVHLNSKIWMINMGYADNAEFNGDALRKEIEEIDRELSPISLQYERLFHHYLISYTAKMVDPLGKPKKYSRTDLLRSEVDCPIDTRKKIDHSKLPNYSELIWDLGGYLMEKYLNIEFEHIIKQD